METAPENWLERLRGTLRDSGLRATPARVAVLRHLQLAPRPLSHAEVVDGLADRGWNRATLYRNLIDLVDAGLARKTELGDRVWRFEAAGAAHSSRSHPHFVCVGCGEVSCLEGVSVNIEPDGGGRAELLGQPLEIQIRGLCADCRRNRKERR